MLRSPAPLPYALWYSFQCSLARCSASCASSCSSSEVWRARGGPSRTAAAAAAAARDNGDNGGDDEPYTRGSESLPLLAALRPPRLRPRPGLRARSAVPLASSSELPPTSPKLSSSSSSSSAEPARARRQLAPLCRATEGRPPSRRLPPLTSLPLLPLPILPLLLLRLPPLPLLPLPLSLPSSLPLSLPPSLTLPRCLRCWLLPPRRRSLRRS